MFILRLENIFSIFFVCLDYFHLETHLTNLVADHPDLAHGTYLRLLSEYFPTIYNARDLSNQEIISGHVSHSLSLHFLSCVVQFLLLSDRWLLFGRLKKFCEDFFTIAVIVIFYVSLFE